MVHRSVPAIHERGVSKFPGQILEISGAQMLACLGLIPESPLVPKFPGLLPVSSVNWIQMGPEVVQLIRGPGALVYAAASDGSACCSGSGTASREMLNATSSLQIEAESADWALYGASRPASQGVQCCTSVRGRPNAHPLTF